MKPIVSESGHVSLSSGVTVCNINDRLRRAIEAMAPLELRGISFSWRMIHLGQGSYTPADSASPHIHEQLHLESILSGSFRFECRSANIDLSMGQSLFVLPHERHNWVCSRAGVMMGALIDISGPAQNEFLEIMRQLSDAMIVVNPESSAVWHRELFRLLTTSDDSPWSLPSITGILRLLMIDLLNEMVDLSPWQPLPADTAGDVRSMELCRHAREFLEANYPHPIQIRDVALQVGVSPRHLNRLYKRINGESIGATLQQLRLQRARQYIREHPEEMIKSVAYRCGFSSPAYFTASYRKAFGQVPAEDRSFGVMDGRR